MNPLPAAIGISNLAVYETTGPDGMDGGSPHVHLTCTEAYVVLGGSGSVQTLGPDGYREEPLAAMDVLWFTPGIIHRLVNDGDLQILVVMQNSGLPEAGDGVFTFPPEVIADPDEYFHHAALSDPGMVYTDREDAAAARRDLAVQGFNALRGAGPEALDAFYAAALNIVTPRLDEWEQRWRDGALAAAERTGELLAAARAGDTSELHRGQLHRGHHDDDPRKLGMCGRLATLEPVGGPA
jgi:mannose-6-phosphate isomerase-like protein (cupin superfamily)